MKPGIISVKIELHQEKFWFNELYKAGIRRFTREKAIKRVLKDEKVKKQGLSIYTRISIGL